MKSELKFLRLEHSELITNTNIGDQIQNLHDEYLSEVQALNQQLSSKSQETMMVLEALDNQKKTLNQRIYELEQELSKVAEQNKKLKADNVKKNGELKEKLEKAYQQLTANDEAANELQRLRT